ncbi:MAG: hypothetical protein M3Y74_15115 [Chloroflexota bacterium]|nr:hypothetical protein [Chloroflexota bacterium]
MFPSSGQTFPLNGSMLFQVQPVSGAQGYLWSFVQNGAVMWQNLAWDGRLGGATYNVGKGSRAEGHMHGGDMQVWVRAWMGGNQWSGLSSLTVRLQGASSGSVQPQPVQPTHPAPGTILYQADTSGGFDKWSGSSAWKHVNGMLVNDGSQKDTIIAPYHPGHIANYAVVAEVQMPGQCNDDIGILARFISSQGYWGGIHCLDFAAIWAGNFPWDDNRLINQNYALDQDWHTFRLEVQGNTVKFLIDGATLAQTTDNRYLDGRGVGVFSLGTQIDIRSFKVIAL